MVSTNSSRVDTFRTFRLDFSATKNSSQNGNGKKSDISSHSLDVDSVGNWPPPVVEMPTDVVEKPSGGVQKGIPESLLGWQKEGLGTRPENPHQRNHV